MILRPRLFAVVFLAILGFEIAKDLVSGPLSEELSSYEHVALYSVLALGIGIWLWALGNALYFKRYTLFWVTVFVWPVAIYLALKEEFPRGSRYAKDDAW